MVLIIARETGFFFLFALAHRDCPGMRGMKLADNILGDLAIKFEFTSGFQPRIKSQGSL